MGGWALVGHQVEAPPDQSLTISILQLSRIFTQLKRKRQHPWDRFLLQLTDIAIRAKCPVHLFYDLIRCPIKKRGQKKNWIPRLQGLSGGLWAGGNSMRLHIGFKPPPPPLSPASKLQPGNKARKAISPLASSKDRKCVRGTGLLSQQNQTSCYNNKLICVSVAEQFKGEPYSSW